MNMNDILMRKSLKQPINTTIIPNEYTVMGVNEGNRHLWEDVMEQSWGDHPAGSYRYVLVANNYYKENRVFVMLNENTTQMVDINQPITPNPRETSPCYSDPFPPTKTCTPPPQ